MCLASYSVLDTFNNRHLKKELKKSAFDQNSISKKGTQVGQGSILFRLWGFLARPIHRIFISSE